VTLQPMQKKTGEEEDSGKKKWVMDSLNEN
jgi:hypothetical protein